MNKKVLKKSMVYIATAILYFLLLVTFVNTTWFESDELDIMINGRGIARGQLLYTDLASQHMPFTYYISALFYKIGATTVTEQRIAFYIFFAVMWTVLYARYGTKFGKKTMFFSPLIFCCLIPTYDMGTTILSEHLAAIGLLIFMLEFLKFVQDKTIGWKESIFISIAVILSFGTIFVAIFPVFVIALGVLGTEIKWGKEKQIGIGTFLINIVRKYLKLFICVMIPWVLLIGYYIIKSTFKAFIFGAYTINREIYPDYIAYGDSIFGTVINTISAAAAQVSAVFVGWTAEYTYVKILQVIVVVCVVVFVLSVWKNYGKFTGLIITLFVVFAGSRGYFNFHGTQFVGLGAFMTSWVLCNTLEKRKVSEGKEVNFRLVIMTMLCITMTQGFFNNTSRITDIKLKEEKDYDTKVVETLTDKDEKVWQLCMNNHVAMQADRLTIGTSAATPWMWRGVGEYQFAQVKEEKPRVILYVPQYEVWGYSMNEYAPEAVEYVEKNYTKLEGAGLVYVRNDYIEEAYEKIKEIQ